MNDGGPQLIQTSAGLALADAHVLLTADFAQVAQRVKKGALARELLVRAAKVRTLPPVAGSACKAQKRPCVIDATAGLGEDSFLLAAAGYEVLLVEHNPVIFALLEDGLKRAAGNAELCQIVEHMHAYQQESTQFLASCVTQGIMPNVVYLDPMFPPKQKAAAPKKKLQLIQGLEAPCDPAQAALLFEAAQMTHPQKIVVKRPLKGTTLTEQKPSYSLGGKTIRYDVYVNA